MAVWSAAAIVEGIDMRTHREKIVIPENHQLILTIPESFPSGPAEVIFLADVEEPRLVKLSGVLADSVVLNEDDPIRDTLAEMREERQRRAAEPL
ncbi:MAG: hypothetical protein HY319_15870 [Armatimonadetes bacterium]|nr:hypothetical protein [Armatimonadota bacterium]